MCACSLFDARLPPAPPHRREVSETLSALQEPHELERRIEDGLLSVDLALTDRMVAVEVRHEGAGGAGERESWLQLARPRCGCCRSFSLPHAAAHSRAQRWEQSASVLLLLLRPSRLCPAQKV